VEDPHLKPIRLVGTASGNGADWRRADRFFVSTAAQAAEGEDMRLEVIKLPDVKKGFVLLPRRWVVERSFGWAARFRRLARDYERLPETLIGLHFLAFAILMTKHVVETMLIVHSS